VLDVLFLLLLRLPSMLLLLLACLMCFCRDTTDTVSWRGSIKRVSSNGSVLWLPQQSSLACD
jgi:hypothetical protein